MTISSVQEEPPADEEFGAEVHGGGRSRFERRQQIVLSCAGCSARNYRTTKARREGAPQLQLKKFCHTCNAHTQHREAV